ncbi:unnamed protein product [Aphanomyces euteiches]|nr:hypothetical protein Ae201684P_002544 [Aphanomyces euteiches]KAH9143200.1 hypothetical protein AeRB84_012777 [Aphanomyces euteiches]
MRVEGGINTWYALVMGMGGCIGLLLLGFISYWCYKLRQDRRRKRSAVASTSSRYESSRLLSRTNLDWPSLPSGSLKSSSSGNLYLSPIPEEFHNDDDMYDEVNRDKEFVKSFCDASEEYMWLDRPALYMGKNRTKSMYLLGRASMPQLGHANFNSDKRFTQLLCTVFPPSKYAAADLPLLKSFFKHIQDVYPRVLPVLDIQQIPETNKMVVVTPYVPQGSLKDYIFHRCKTAMVQIPYHHKYKRHGSGKPLGHSTIARYGRDILLGMQELQQAGLPYYQLHSGNVLLLGDQATLSGYESTFFEPTTSETIRPSPIKLFGQLIFEMVFGSEWSPNRMRMDGTLSYGTLNASTDQMQFQDVLDVIFAPNSTATIETLLEMPLFRRSTPKIVRSFTRRDQLLEVKTQYKRQPTREMQELVKAALKNVPPPEEHEPMVSIVIQVA